MNYSQSSDLDDEQSAAVVAKEPAIAVLAGPGSGKTRTLSYRARHLLSTTPSDSALLLTFTNKAAAEMKARTIDVAKVPSGRLHAGTFHTFCGEVLRAHGRMVGISNDFEIIDPSEARQIAAALPEAKHVSRLIDRWSAARLRRLDVDDDLRDAGTAYERAKRDANIVDFDDLVVYAASILETHADVAEAFAGTYPHVLIDEFQDTNAAQTAIINALAARARTVSIFADDDQAIFGFAGAEADNIRRFVTAAGAKAYPLTTNYRSGDAIVAIANSIIMASPESSGRLMRPWRNGGQVDLRAFPDMEAEAQSIATEITAAVSGGMEPSDIAVLVRANWRADSVLQRLQGHGVPISDWRSETNTPEDRRLMAACLAAVRGTLNSRQVQVLCHLMEVPSPGPCETDVFLANHASKPLAQGLSMMRDLVFDGASPHAVARAAQAAVASQRPAFGHVLAGIVDAVANFESYDPEFSLEHLLAELALGSVGRAPTQGGGIKVASLHRTKGLQWKCVYLLGLEEGQLPNGRASSRAELAEERRLCFVGVSRAEDRLVLTRSNITGGSRRAASRFLGEMGFAS